VKKAVQGRMTFEHFWYWKQLGRGSGEDWSTLEVTCDAGPNYEEGRICDCPEGKRQRDRGGLVFYWDEYQVMRRRGT